MEHPNFGKVRCYTLETFKTLLQVDYRLQAALKEVELRLEERNLAQNNAKDYKTYAEAAERQYILIMDDRDRLTAKWTEENKKRHIAEATGIWDSWVTYALIVVGTVAITEGVILYVISGD